MTFINAQGNEVEGNSDLANALLNEPEGATCGFCGGPNDFADDCGFYYVGPELKPVCFKCYEGSPGRAHIARYGVGER